MPVPSFPLTRQPDRNGYREGRQKTAKLTRFDNGTEATRPMGTVSLRTFSCRWGSLTNEEKELVEEFFGRYQGYAFNFTPPFTDRPVLVRFDANQIDSDLVRPGWNSRTGMRWGLSLRFIEMTDSPLMDNTAQEVEP